MEKKESKGFVELEWICPNCDSKNKGSKKTCENCGAPQPDNVKFQRASDEKIVTDAKAVETAKAGADIHCGFCGTRNPGSAVTCSQCGGELKEGKARQAGQILQAAPPAPKAVTCTNCGTENPGSERTCKQCGSPLPRAESPATSRPSPAPAFASPAIKAQNKKVNWLLFGGIGAFLVVCCIAILFMVLPSKAIKGTVTDVQWQTSVPVQEVQAVNYSNERGSAPSDAYDVSCRTEEQEVCEEKTVDQGNGFAEVVKECHTESEQYCNYTVDEWKTIQTYTLDGNDLYPVYESPSLFNGQRLGTSTQTFTVTFSTPNGQETYAPNSESEFQQFQIGSTWTLKLNALGGVLSVGQ
ncbi:MAG: zinc ribbon domain-containing protein [Anaerolineales bacterium]|nr:zinc ribbon domain-containing protein [Anaerolineales bacterium]